MVRSDAMVYGESARAIRGALAGTVPDISDDGMYQFDWHLTPDEAGPVARATMRAEAALLLADASLFDGHGTLRTPEQRRADALFEVVTETGEALGLRTR